VPFFDRYPFFINRVVLGLLWVPKDERDKIFHEYFLQTDNVDPIAPVAHPAAPAEKKKAWNLNWSPLS